MPDRNVRPLFCDLEEREERRDCRHQRTASTPAPRKSHSSRVTEVKYVSIGFQFRLFLRFDDDVGFVEANEHIEGTIHQLVFLLWPNASFLSCPPVFWSSRFSPVWIVSLS